MPEKPRNRIVKTLEVTPSWAIGVGLSLLGISLVVVGNSCWTWLNNLNGSLPALAGAFGEALLIAGLLAMLVDPFLKARLLREASRNLFEHIIGFDHEPEIKQRLRDIVFQTKLYRTNSRISFAVAADAENTVSIQLTLEYELSMKALITCPSPRS
jgi:hypothetical protein